MRTVAAHDIIDRYEEALDHEYISLNEDSKQAIEKLINDIMDMLSGGRTKAI